MVSESVQVAGAVIGALVAAEATGVTNFSGKDGEGQQQVPTPQIPAEAQNPITVVTPGNAQAGLNRFREANQIQQELANIRASLPNQLVDTGGSNSQTSTRDQTSSSRGTGRNGPNGRFDLQDSSYEPVRVAGEGGKSVGDAVGRAIGGIETTTNTAAQGLRLLAGKEANTANTWNTKYGGKKPARKRLYEGPLNPLADGNVWGV